MDIELSYQSLPIVGEVYARRERAELHKRIFDDDSSVRGYGGEGLALDSSRWVVVAIRNRGCAG